MSRHQPASPATGGAAALPHQRSSFPVRARATRAGWLAPGPSPRQVRPELPRGQIPGSGAGTGAEPRWGGCYIRSCYRRLGASAQPSRKVGRNRFSHGKLPTERGNALEENWLWGRSWGRCSRGASRRSRAWISRSGRILPLGTNKSVEQRRGKDSIPLAAFLHSTHRLILTEHQA
ncbi:unnamed protein product [Coccothraustes coccothraustes]